MSYNLNLISKREVCEPVLVKQARTGLSVSSHTTNTIRAAFPRVSGCSFTPLVTNVLCCEYVQ